MGGLAGLVRGIAIGSVPLVIASCAALFGAGLAPGSPTDVPRQPLLKPSTGRTKHRRGRKH
jgi:hypothetical protein